MGQKQVSASKVAPAPNGCDCGCPHSFSSLKTAGFRFEEEPELFSLACGAIKVFLRFQGSLAATQCAVYRFAIYLEQMVADHEPNGGNQNQADFYLAMEEFLDEAADWPSNPPNDDIEEARAAIADALGVEVDDPKVTGASEADTTVNNSTGKRRNSNKSNGTRKRKAGNPE